VIKIEAVVIRERIETVIDAVEEATGHVGVTVIEAVGHGRQRGITHEYRGRVFESRFLPKALLIFIVEDARAEGVVAAIVAITTGASSSSTTNVSSALGRKRDSKTRPRYSCVIPRCRPCPTASMTVTPTCPVSSSTASITVSIRSRITTASTLTIWPPPLV
jgi:nitrogen regulatory protein P-II 1